MSTVELLPEVTATHEQWEATVAKLKADVTAWCQREGWQVQPERHSPSETEALEIATPDGALLLRPVGQHVFQGLGRIDLVAEASRNRVRLLLTPTEWVIRTESGIDWPHPWSRETFVEVARALAKAW